MTGPAATSTDTPDWEALTLELRCPRCGYNLRLLPQPRCPECGLQFAWAEVIAAAQRKLDCPLFEYHWRDRPIRSFLVTIWLAMRPYRLWQRVPATAKPRIAPVVVLLLIAASAQVVLCATTEYVSDHYHLRHFTPGTYVTITPGPPDIQGHAYSVEGQIAIAAAACLALQVFRKTRDGRRIRRGQSLRVAMLAALGLVAWHATMETVFDGLTELSYWIPRPYWWHSRRWFHVGWLIVGTLPLLVFFRSLSLGLETQVRLRRARLVAWSIGALVLLAILAPAPVFIAHFGPHNIYVDGVLWKYWRWTTLLIDWLVGRA